MVEILKNSNVTLKNASEMPPKCLPNDHFPIYVESPKTPLLQILVFHYCYRRTTVSCGHMILPVFRPPQCPLSKMTLEGGKRILSINHTNKKSPLPFQTLCDLHKKLYDGDLTQVRSLALFTTGFFGFFSI